MYKLILIPLILLLSSCGEDKPIPKDFDRSGKVQKITVYVYPDKASMRKARQGFDGSKEKDLMGWSAWTANDPAKCKIHVVKLKSATDNSQMTTWGHELVHCVYGSFHE